MSTATHVGLFNRRGQEISAEWYERLPIADEVTWQAGELVFVPPEDPDDPEDFGSYRQADPQAFGGPWVVSAMGKFDESGALIDRLVFFSDAWLVYGDKLTVRPYESSSSFSPAALNLPL